MFRLASFSAPSARRLLVCWQNGEIEGKTWNSSEKCYAHLDSISNPLLITHLQTNVHLNVWFWIAIFLEHRVSFNFFPECFQQVRRCSIWFLNKNRYCFVWVNLWTMLSRRPNSNIKTGLFFTARDSSRLYLFQYLWWVKWHRLIVHDQTSLLAKCFACPLAQSGGGGGARYRSKLPCISLIMLLAIQGGIP